MESCYGFSRLKTQVQVSLRRCRAGALLRAAGIGALVSPAWAGVAATQLVLQRQLLAGGLQPAAEQGGVMLATLATNAGSQEWQGSAALCRPREQALLHVPCAHLLLLHSGRASMLQLEDVVAWGGAQVLISVQHARVCTCLFVCVCVRIAGEHHAGGAPLSAWGLVRGPVMGWRHGALVPSLVCVESKVGGRVSPCACLQTGVRKFWQLFCWLKLSGRDAGVHGRPGRCVCTTPCSGAATQGPA